MHCCQFVHGVAHHCICLIRGVHLQRRRELYENHTHTHTHTICLIRGVHLQRRRGLYENHTHTHTHTHTPCSCACCQRGPCPQSQCTGTTLPHPDHPRSLHLAPLTVCMFCVSCVCVCVCMPVSLHPHPGILRSTMHLCARAGLASVTSRVRPVSLHTHPDIYRSTTHLCARAGLASITSHVQPGSLHLHPGCMWWIGHL
jgi:hypothetical protein